MTDDIRNGTNSNQSRPTGFCFVTSGIRFVVDAIQDATDAIRFDAQVMQFRSCGIPDDASRTRFVLSETQSVADGIHFTPNENAFTSAAVQVSVIGLPFKTTGLPFVANWEAR